MAPTHVLLVAFPEQGHSTPMLSLASHLAASGCKVTFLTAHKAPLAARSDHPQNAHAVAGPVDGSAGTSIVPNDQHSPPPGELPTANGTSDMPPFASNLHIRILPYTGAPSFLTEASSRFDILKETLAGLADRQEIVEKMVQDSKISEAPISCIGCDVFLCSWVMPLAQRQAIRSVALVPCSLASFYHSYLMKKEMDEELERVLHALGIVPSGNALAVVPPGNAALSSKEQQTLFAEVKRVFFGATDHIEMSSHVLANSCEDLDAVVLDVLSASKLNITLIGPLLPAWEAGNDGWTQSAAGNSVARRAGSPYADDESCLPWLDRQGKGSVLLVAFGSEVKLNADQMRELAIGIEASGCKFLWVVRPDAHMPPDTFLERMQGIGMCISWAPQRAVLQHAAVGGFLTHCGWNSTVESVLAGVPMLCLPLNGDQYMNAHVIQLVWKVGLRVAGPPNAEISSADVERKVRELFSSEELRQRVGMLQEAVKGALPQSRSAISSFVQEISSH